MKRLRGIPMVLAVALAVLLPLEQAHCLWMPSPSMANPCAPVQSAMDHGCCAAAQPAKAASHRHEPSRCPCIQLPSGTLPAATVQASSPTAQPAAVSGTHALPALSEFVPALAPAPDVGSPPLPVGCGAHSLRAPPLSA